MINAFEPNYALANLGRLILEQQYREVPLDCPREPNGRPLEEHEPKPFPQSRFLPEQQGFQAAESHLDPTCRCSLRVQLLSPSLGVDAPAETNNPSPCRISCSLFQVMWKGGREKKLKKKKGIIPSLTQWL